VSGYPLGGMSQFMLVYLGFGVMVIHLVHRRGVAVSKLFEQRHADVFT
jgi:hypothetical protein